MASWRRSLPSHPPGLVPEERRIVAGFAGTVADGPLTGAAIDSLGYLMTDPG